MAKQIKKILFNIRIEVDMSEEFLDKFQIKESGNTFVCDSWYDNKSTATVYHRKGNMELGHQIVNKCFRNNSRLVHWVKAEEMEE